jgi:cyclophilin family peptidyl-prolyl cis-trans isomerase
MLVPRRARLAVLLVFGLGLSGLAQRGATPPLLSPNAPALLALGDQLLTQRWYRSDDWDRTFTYGSKNELTTWPPAFQLLLNAAGSPNVEDRRLFLRLIARLQMPQTVPFIVKALTDESAANRAEAASALILALSAHERRAPDQWTQAAATALLTRLTIESDGAAAGAILTALGSLRYPNDAQVVDVERLLIRHAQVTNPLPSGFAFRRDGALRGLTELARHHPGHRVEDATRRVLRRLASPPIAGTTQEVGPYAPALEALVVIQDVDDTTIQETVSFECRRSPRFGSRLSEPDCGWEIRRLGLQLVPPGVAKYAPLVTSALHDPSSIVRIEALRLTARNTTAKTCGPFTEALIDRTIPVVLEALSLLSPACEERVDVAMKLTSLAQRLSDPANVATWHVPAAALETLARFAPKSAQTIALSVKDHKVWQVRAAVARVAGAIADEALASGLAKDPAENVRTEALKALYRMKSPATWQAVATALDSDDHQLVLTAAALLNTAPDGLTAVPKLLAALQRLSRKFDPSSREARLEILARLKQFAPVDGRLANIVRPLVNDPDPVIAMNANDLLKGEFGSSVTTIALPTAEALTSIGGCARVVLENGSSFSIVLNSADAPYTVSRFSALVRNHYYDGLTFHRVERNAFVEGGSPAANAYQGADFLRDELGPTQHLRGVVALSRHEHQTGNMQFFVNLVDNPAFDRQFTAFGVVGPCAPSDPPVARMMQVVDGLLDGAKILRIEAVAGSR